MLKDLVKVKFVSLVVGMQGTFVLLHYVRLYCLPVCR